MKNLDDGMSGYVPPKLIGTSPAPIVSMCVFKDRLFIATTNGVFERDEQGDFQEVRLVYADRETS